MGLSTKVLAAAARFNIHLLTGSTTIAIDWAMTPPAHSDNRLTERQRRFAFHIAGQAPCG